MTTQLIDQPSAWAETTWYDESAALEPRDLELFEAPGDDEDELDDLDEDDDYRD